MTTTDSRLVNYLHWQMERGFRWLHLNPIKQETNASSTEAATSSKVLFVHDSAESTPQSDALFQKMIIAMKFSADKFALVDLQQFSSDLLTKQPASLVVFLGQNAKNAFFPKAALGQFVSDEKLKNIPCICTYHPQTLLLVPEMKKAAWLHLQTVMKRENA